RRKGGELISKLGAGLIEHVPGMGNKFIRFVLKVFGRFSLYQTGLNLAESFISGAWAKLKGVGSWMKHHLVDPVVRWVKSGFGIASPSKVFTGIGGQLISGLKSGITGAMSAIGHWIKGAVVDPVVGAVKHFFGIKSPSRVFMSIGGHLVS